MARKSEIGIEYFPMNSDIVHNPKVKLVVAEFGSKMTWAVLLPLYCKIYREKGYWVDWFDEDSKLLFAQDECKMEPTVVNEIVTGCIRRSLFDKRVFDLFGVLTSDRIQENYLEAKRRARNIQLIKEFLLVPESVYKSNEFVTLIPITATVITKKVTVIPQKEKENEKEKLEGDGDERKPPKVCTDEEKLFEQFQVWLKKHAPRVNQLKDPLTIEQYLNLRKKIPKDVLTNVLKSMQNKADLLKKYVSANLTIQSWSAREQNGNGVLPDKDNVNEKLKSAFQNGPN